MIQTKTFYYNPMQTYERGMESFSDHGYSLAIPWNDVTTTGWMNPTAMKIWGTENKLTVRDDPEYYAPGNFIRSNVIPSINPNDPIYMFSRKDYTYNLW